MNGGAKPVNGALQMEAGNAAIKWDALKGAGDGFHQSSLLPPRFLPVVPFRRVVKDLRICFEARRRGFACGLLSLLLKMPVCSSEQRVHKRAAAYHRPGVRIRRISADHQQQAGAQAQDAPNASTSHLTSHSP